MKAVPSIWAGFVFMLFASPASLACAQTPDLVTAAVTTDYRAKGISKSLDDGSASVAVEWVDEAGRFYGGIGAATENLPIGATYEADAKAGVRTRAHGWALDFAVFYRKFPDADRGSDDDYVELRAQASRAFGPVALRVLTWQTPDNLGPAGAANWSEARLMWPVAPRVRGSIALGHHDQENAPTYSAWNAGVAIPTAPGLDFDLRWYDTNAHGAGPRFAGEVVASLVYILGR